MDDVLLRRVRAMRARNPFQPIGIANAVAIIRYEDTRAPEPWAFLDDLTDYPCKVSGTVGSLTITAEVEYDEDSALGQDDVSGTFTDTESATTIKNTCRDWATDYKFYEPATMRREETVETYRAMGMSRSVALDAKRAAVVQDMYDDASRTYYGVTVTIYAGDVKLGAASLWSIDTIDGYAGKSYMIECAVDLIGEALHQAQQDAPQTIEQLRGRADTVAGSMGEIARLLGDRPHHQ